MHSFIWTNTALIRFALPLVVTLVALRAFTNLLILAQEGMKLLVLAFLAILIKDSSRRDDTLSKLCIKLVGSLSQSKDHGSQLSLFSKAIRQQKVVEKQGSLVEPKRPDE
jgi:hypothetical protein